MKTVDKELLAKADDLYVKLGGIGNKDARIVRALRERGEVAFRFESMLQNFLAVLHRDGGQHTAEVGLEQSIIDAEHIFYCYQTRISDLEKEIKNGTSV